jgi:hypothetical protein
MSGYRSRARVHSVFWFQSGGKGKSSYSIAGYSLKGLCASRAPQAASARILTSRGVRIERPHLEKHIDVY